MKKYIFIALMSIFTLTSGEVLAQTTKSKVTKKSYVQKKNTKSSNSVNLRPRTNKKQKVAKVQTKKTNANRRKQTPKKSNKK